MISRAGAIRREQTRCILHIYPSRVGFDLAWLTSQIFQSPAYRYIPSHFVMVASSWESAL